MAKFSLNEPVDVCVIGTGAGGGNLVRQLCAAGVKVVALEAGPRFVPHRDFLNNEWVMFSKTAWLDPVLGDGEDQTGLPIWLVKGVGGTTIHWAGASLRLQPHEFKAKTVYGNIPGATLEDWPLTLDELLPYYKKAETYMGVAGRVQPPPIGNTNFLVMKKGADRLGLNAHPGTMAINARGPYDGRPQCMQCGFCFQGCTPRAKWSTLYEAIPKAEATGNLDLRPNSMALKINTDGKGRARSITYATPDGKLYEQKARAIALACNSIQTPRLLLNSASSEFPHGVANGSGQVGKNYTRHLTASTYAIFPKPVHAYKGITMMGIIEDFADHQPKARNFAGGFYFETIMLGPAFLSVFVRPGPDTSTPDALAAWGEPLKNLMDNYINIAGMWIVGEDLPTPNKHVTLHPTQKDQYGMPVPVVTVNDHPNDKEMRKFAWARGRDIFEAAGAVKVYDTPPYPATHNLGTCRMGDNPNTSVVNKWGQTHEVKNLFITDGSVFTTSAAENPTLTISALAIRQADYIMDQMKKREI
jgi:choline dehydrogenase-like flavoprotein